MLSIFQLINKYQDLIIAFVTLVLGTVQTGVSSFAIHKLVLDEHFLIYVIGHAMYKKTKNLEEAMAHYASIREFMRKDLFQTMDFIKIAFSIALIAGVFQALVSLLLISLRHKSYMKKLWICVSTMTLFGLSSGFGLGIVFVVPNILYYQIFLATTGVNFFILLHLVVSMFIQEIFEPKNKKPEDTSAETETENQIESGSAEEGIQSSEAETQTPSIALVIQDEFPLPLPPPSPILVSTNASENRGTTTSSNVPSSA